MYDLISIGDTTIDHILTLHEASVNCTLKKHECQLCLQYAEKIPVEAWKRVVAGNAANNAVGSARLGMKTAIVTIVGDDPEGALITSTLDNEQIDTRLVTVDKKQGTNASTVISFQGERTILVFHEPRRYKLPKLPKTQWIYYTSVGKHHEQYNRQIVQYLKKSKTNLAYNPGTHQLNAGQKAMKDILKFCTVLFVNKEEAARIVGTFPTIKDTLDALCRLGPLNVVITDGDKGAFATNGGQTFYMPIIPTQVVEKTGAGDSFATACIAALHNGASLEEALTWGGHNSASVIAFVGPQTGLLTLKKLKLSLSKSPLKPKKI